MGAALDGRFVAFDYHRGSAAARHQSVAVAVKRARCLGGVVFADRECADAVETAYRERVDFLRAAADHHVLQAVAYQQRSEADGVRAAGASARHGQVDAFELEDAREVHRHGRVHRLEDGARADQRGVFLLAHRVDAADHGVGAAVVAIEQAHFVAVKVILVDFGVAQGFGGGHVGILRLLGHVDTLVARKDAFQVRFFDICGQAGAETHLLAFGVQHDARLCRVQGIAHFVKVFAQTRVDAHSGYYNSFFHNYCVSLIYF